MEIKNMSVKIENISAADIAKHSKSDTKENAPKAKDAKDTHDEASKDDSTVSDKVKIENIKEEKPEEEIGKDQRSRSKGSRVDDVIKEEIKTETDECKDDKAEDKKVVSDRYANLFPHLAALSTGQSPQSEGSEAAPGTEETNSATEMPEIQEKTSTE